MNKYVALTAIAVLVILGLLFAPVAGAKTLVSPARPVASSHPTNQYYYATVTSLDSNLADLTFDGPVPFGDDGGPFGWDLGGNNTPTVYLDGQQGTWEVGFNPTPVPGRVLIRFDVSGSGWAVFGGEETHYLVTYVPDEQVLVFTRLEK